MNFLNAILLAGAAAFLIPLAIHLLNKRRVQTVRWGAMFLLQEALQQRKRNLKIEQLLLLIVRVGIPIVLALCLARPVFNLLRQLPGMGKNSLVIVLDNSYSMRAPTAGGTARDTAQRDVKRILENLPGGSDVSVILAGQPSHLLLDQPTTALDLLPKDLEKVTSFAGPVALNDAFQLASAELKRMGNAGKEVVLISDFQQSDWRSLQEGGTFPALEALKQSDPAPLLTFYRIASDLQENLVLSSVEPSAFVVAKDQTIALRARIQNHGSRAYQDLAVHLEADGSRVRSSRISIAANAESILTLNHTFSTAGDHSLTVRVEGDTFTDDNSFSLVIPVREQVNTLLLNGGKNSGTLAGSTDFLEIALTPHQRASATLKDVIKSNVLDYKQLRDKSFENVEVVVMSNVEKLNGRGFTDLQQFVERGGGLLIFMGPDCDERWYKQEFFRDGKGLFPAPLEGFGHVDDGQTPARIISQRFTHPATSYFNEARGMRLQDAAFTHWQRFGKLSDDTRVLLSLDRGDPFLIEKPYGQGRVIVAATTANAQWSNLPLQPVFVPLMQRLVTYLATQNMSPQFQPCGSALHVGLDKSQANDVFTLIDPQNQIHELKPQTSKEGVTFLEFADTQTSGIYELRSNLAAKTDPPRLFAFNLNPAESNLVALPEAQVREMAVRFGASFTDNADHYQRLDLTRRHGSELWQPLLALLLVALFGEVFLQQRIARA